MTGKIIEELLTYGRYHLGLQKLDEIYLRNLLTFKLKADYNNEKLSESETDIIKNLSVPDVLIDKLILIAEQKQLAEKGMELSFASEIMSYLTPTPQKTVENFFNIKNERGIKEAAKYIYDLSIKNYYIQKTAIDKNIIWRADFENEENHLEITINLSKPEKDNKEILKQLKTPAVDYPKCALCIENLGFSGSAVKPPRQNIRILPLKLGGEDWFMQYSPYLYYDEHCIVISENHTPMKVDKSTICKLLDFVDLFPHYFIGSNASIPIVGGSILSHEHFQGGGHKMPLHYAKERRQFDCKIKDLKVFAADWYNSVVRLVSADRDSVFKGAVAVMNSWHGYNDLDNGIIAQTDQRHNAITPILRKENGNYIFDIILRNNRTDEKYPDGIFHAHPQNHNIKKEGIGLIEAMGLFILPGRLKKQTAEIEKILCGERTFDEDLILHKNMIEYLTEKHKGKKIDAQQAMRIVRKYIDDTCRDILINTAVFKPDINGFKAFDKFINSIDWNV
jgi:UDPglucose--hexose-1-phosphate uridylyltransferase